MGNGQSKKDNKKQQLLQKPSIEKPSKKNARTPVSNELTNLEAKRGKFSEEALVKFAPVKDPTGLIMTLGPVFAAPNNTLPDCDSSDFVAKLSANPVRCANFVTENNVVIETATNFVPQYMPIPKRAIVQIQEQLCLVRPINNIIDCMFRRENILQELVDLGLVIDENTSEFTEAQIVLLATCWVSLLIPWAAYLPSQPDGCEVNHTHKVLNAVLGHVFELLTRRYAVSMFDYAAQSGRHTRPDFHSTFIDEGRDPASYTAALGAHFVGQFKMHHLDKQDFFLSQDFKRLLADLPAQLAKSATAAVDVNLLTNFGVAVIVDGTPGQQVAYLSFSQCRPVLQGSQAQVLGYQFVRLWQTILPYEVDFPEAIAAPRDLAATYPTGCPDVIHRFGQLLGMLIYAASAFPVKDAGAGKFAFPTVSVPSLATASAIQSLASTAVAAPLPMAIKADTQAYSNREYGKAQLPLAPKHMTTLLARFRGDFKFERARPYDRSYRASTTVFEKASVKGVSVGDNVGVVKFAKTLLEMDLITHEAKLVVVAQQGPMQHVLHEGRYSKTVDFGSLQVMPRCIMLDALGPDAQRLALLFFKQLPDMLTEFMLYKWLIVDVKPSNFGFHNDVLKLIDLDSIVLYYPHDGYSQIPQPHVHNVQFSAPECQVAGSTVTLSSDVYAFAQLMVHMASMLPRHQQLIMQCIASQNACSQAPDERPDMLAFISQLRALAGKL
eukprot:TRINITY_DN2296_c0_g1_i1.p1 TRINITY_DN2296_c0_g1~~TRINITY_DN2296_c0_g1_i1.p1  ORF type:complete len:722 (+),score=118.62 TRINITY_DN2296_c0_g1_i1:43-2208(+)